MVSIVGIESKVNKSTLEEYVVVVLQGEVEIKKSKSTSKFYLGAKQIKLPTTLDAQRAKELIGKTLPGAIERIDCPTYEIKLGNGKKLKISHTFQYTPDPASLCEVEI